MLNFNSGEIKSSIEKFKRMLKTNMNFYFDAQEFEDIIVHYLSHGDNQLAKKALQMGLGQHPSCHELLLLQSEINILDKNYDVAKETFRMHRNILILLMRKLLYKEQLLHLKKGIIRVL